MKTNCGSSVAIGKTVCGSTPIPIPQRPGSVLPSTSIKTRDELIAERRKKRKN